MKSLKTKIVHAVTKGKRHSVGCTYEKERKTTRTNKQTKTKKYAKKREYVSERNIVTMNECFRINAPQ